MDVRKIIFFADENSLAKIKSLNIDDMEHRMLLRVATSRYSMNKTIYLPIIQWLLDFKIMIGDEDKWPLINIVSNVTLLRLFSEHKWNLNFDNDVLIRYAASYGFNESYKYLKSIGLNPKSNDCEAFVLACQSGHLDIAKDIIGTNLSLASCRNNSAFRMSVDLRNLESVKYLVEECMIDPKVQDNIGLYIATSQKNIDMVIYLLSKGGTLDGKVDHIDVMDSWNAASVTQQETLKAYFEPFMQLKFKKSIVASSIKMSKKITLLDQILSNKILSYGPFEPDNDFLDAFNCSCQLGKEKIVMWLFKSSSKKFDISTGMNLAISFGHDHILQKFEDIEWNINPEAIKNAVKNGCIPILRYLDKKGYDMPGLDVAISCGNIVSLQYLINEVKKIPSPEDSILASQAGIVDIISICYHDTTKDICLQNICKYGFLKSIEFLLEKGAKPNEIALKNACYFGSKKILQLLGATKIYPCLLFNNLPPTVKPDMETLQKICEKGQSVALIFNNLWKNDFTCITNAAKNGYSDLIQTSDKNLYKEAFVLAAENGFISVIEAIESKANIDIQIVKTAFINAAYYGQIYVVHNLYKKYKIDKQTLLSAKAWTEYNSEFSFVPEYINSLL